MTKYCTSPSGGSLIILNNGFSAVDLSNNKQKQDHTHNVINHQYTYWIHLIQLLMVSALVLHIPCSCVTCHISEL